MYINSKFNYADFFLDAGIFIKESDDVCEEVNLSYNCDRNEFMCNWIRLLSFFFRNYN